MDETAKLQASADYPIKAGLRVDARAYDALAARLASVERERDEIMAMAERREDALRARLAEAEALLREGCGYIDDVPDRRSAYKDRVRTFLAPDTTADQSGSADPIVHAQRRGYDHGYAAYLADRRTTRTVKSTPRAE